MSRSGSKQPLDGQAERRSVLAAEFVTNEVRILAGHLIAIDCDDVAPNFNCARRAGEPGNVERIYVSATPPRSKFSNGEAADTECSRFAAHRADCSPIRLRRRNLNEGRQTRAFLRAFLSSSSDLAVRPLK